MKFLPPCRFLKEMAGGNRFNIRASPDAVMVQMSFDRIIESKSVAATANITNRHARR